MEALSELNRRIRSYENLSKYIYERLDSEKVAEIKSQLKTCLQVIVPTHELEEVENFYKVGFVKEQEIINDINSIAACIRIKTALKQEEKKNILDSDNRTRIKSLASQLLRIQNGLSAAKWVPKLLYQYDKLIYAISHQTILKLYQIIIETEDLFISCMSLEMEGSFRVLYYRFTNISKFEFDCLAFSRNNSDQSLDSILPRYLACITSSSIRHLDFFPSKIGFTDFWNPILKSILAILKIDDNDFVKCAAFKALCGKPKDKYYAGIIEPQKLESLMALFFGNIKDYKFYFMISKIYNSMIQPIISDSCKQQLTIILTSVRNHYTTGPQTLVIDQPLEIQPSIRGDGLVIFGRHPYADVIFPKEDKNIDLVSMILINVKNNSYLIDCSSKGICSIRLENLIYYPLKEGNLIRIGECATIYIEKINIFTASYSTEEEVVDSSIMIRFLEDSDMSNSFIISTSHGGKGRYKFMPGQGSNAAIKDLFMPGSNSQHCELRYSDDCEWQIYDKCSKSGTFLLLKSENQLKFDQSSSAVPVFASVSDTKRVIVLHGYTFILAR